MVSDINLDLCGPVVGVGRFGNKLGRTIFLEIQKNFFSSFFKVHSKINTNIDALRLVTYLNTGHVSFSFFWGTPTD